MTTPSFERHEARNQHRASVWFRVVRRPDAMVAIVAFVGAGTLWWFGRPAFSASDVAEAANSKRRAVEIARNRGEIDTRGPLVKTETAVRALESSVAVPTAPKGLPAGLTYPGTWLETTRPGETNVVKFGAPRKLDAAAEPGAVVLSWAPPEATVVLSAYEIHRSEDGGPFGIVGKVAGDVLTWRDESVVAGRPYAYRVIAVTSDALLVGSGRSRSPESDPAALRAASDSKIELVDVAEGVVSLRIRKKTGSDGWRTRIVTVAEGKPVGDVDPSTGLDWTTGRTVAKIAEALSETERSRDEVVFDAAGRVVLEGGIPKRVSTVRRDVWRTVSVTLSGGGAPDETLTIEKR